MIRIALALSAIGLLFSQAAEAQWGSVIVQQPAPVIVQRPGTVVWQQPAPVVVPAPVTTFVAPPVVVSPSPTVVMSPVPVTRVYRPPIVTYQPVRQTVIRNRPILGGTVTRNRYGFQRVVF